jgi:hypothetical protein
LKKAVISNFRQLTRAGQWQTTRNHKRAAYYKKLHRAKDLLRWQDDIKMDLKEIRYEGVDWIHLA